MGPIFGKVTGPEIIKNSKKSGGTKVLIIIWNFRRGIANNLNVNLLKY